MMGWDPKYASIRGQYRLTHCYISLDTLKNDAGIYSIIVSSIDKLPGELGWYQTLPIIALGGKYYGLDGEGVAKTIWDHLNLKKTF